MHKVQVTGCAPISHLTTEGNFHTNRDDHLGDTDYYFYIFTQEKESTSQITYLLYKLDSNSGLFKEIKTSASFFEKPDVTNKASLDPLEAFE